MNTPTIGLDTAAREKIVRELEVLLSTMYVLAIKTQLFHWNVQGPDFKPLHLFFEDQYDHLFDHVDLIAERITALGHKSPGSMAFFIKHSIIAEEASLDLSAGRMVEQLLKDQEALICRLRSVADLTSELHDGGGNNMITAMLEDHEKTAWMLRATAAK